MSDVKDPTTQVVKLQSDLLDYTGHVRRGLTQQRARDLVEKINGTRETLGWRPLDMTGRWRRR